MNLKYAIVIPATFAGALYLTTISPARGQPVHGESIDASAPALSAPAPAPTSTLAAMSPGGATKADFETLASFPFDAPNTAVTNKADLEKVAKQIPETVKKLDGKTVRIRGFMMPTKESAGKATEFLITRSQPSCCFSGATGLNEFITVKAAANGVAENMDDAVAIEGTLHVGLVTDSGYVVGLYQMDGGKIIPAGH
ncbi:MAG TPA: DUF3299 domain-containing protein [Verrucomicrobiae bacterium]|jgi:hypothetical protein|nr:DUF3299 domain-containing protein [Verrucomicrobiae bacterium]